MLFSPDQTPFTTGSAPFNSRPASVRETANRVFIRIIINGLNLEAVLDTGGAYLVLDPEAAHAADISPIAQIDSDSITVRGYSWHGALYRLPVRFHAADGDDLSIEVTAFVPRIDPGESWPWPSFLGWHCCLERLRIAIDPHADLFHFGP